MAEAREAFDLYISQFVVDEFSAGDPASARERLRVLKYLSLLDITPEVTQLTSEILACGKMPKKASTEGRGNRVRYLPWARVQAQGRIVCAQTRKRFATCQEMYLLGPQDLQITRHCLNPAIEIRQ